MSNRIGNNVTSNPYGYGANQEAAATPPNPSSVARANRTMAVAHEQWRAKSNDADASPAGKVAEQSARLMLEQLPPGGRVQFSMEAKAGVGIELHAKLEYTAERLEDGRIEVTRTVSGGAEASQDRSVYEVGVQARASGSTTWRFETNELAADSIAALGQQDVMDYSLLGDSSFDRDASARVASLNRHPASHSVSFGVEAFAKAKLSAGVASLDESLKATAEPKLTVDLEKGTVVIEEAFTVEGKLGASVGLNVQLLKSTIGTDAAALSVSNKVLTTYLMTPEQKARYQANSGAAAVDDIVSRGTPTKTLVQKLDVSFAGRALSATRKVELTADTPLTAALDPRQGKLEWQTSLGVNVREKTKVDLHIGELEAEAVIQLPGQKLGSGTLADLDGILASLVTDDERLLARRVLENIRR